MLCGQGGVRLLGLTPVLAGRPHSGDTASRGLMAYPLAPPIYRLFLIHSALYHCARSLSEACCWRSASGAVGVSGSGTETCTYNACGLPPPRGSFRHYICAGIAPRYKVFTVSVSSTFANCSFSVGVVLPLAAQQPRCGGCHSGCLWMLGSPNLSIGCQKSCTAPNA